MFGASAPKSRNASRTKNQILESAKTAFFDLGYSNASVREIAAAAGVDPVLVRRYFGSKANLFEAVLIESFEAGRNEDLESASFSGFGRRLALQMLADGSDRHFALVTLTTEDAEARAIGDRIMRERILPQTAEWLGPPDALTRATNFFILVNGFALHLHLTKFGAAEPRTMDGSVDWFAQSIQAIIDQSTGRHG